MSKSSTSQPDPPKVSAPCPGAGKGRGPGDAGGWPSTVKDRVSGDKRSNNPPSNGKSS